MTPMRRSKPRGRNSRNWRRRDGRLQDAGRLRLDAVYLTDINAETCIGCGRCFKVCPQNVMALYGVNDEGEILGIVTDDDDDDFDGDLNRKIMKVEHAGACIGCNACCKGLSEELPDSCAGRSDQRRDRP